MSLCPRGYGPYSSSKVKGRLVNTPYRVAIPRSKSKSEKVHINRLKLWRTPMANLFRVVIGQVSEGSEEPPGRVLLSQSCMSPAQKEELEGVLNSFKHVISDRLGESCG